MRSYLPKTMIFISLRRVCIVERAFRIPEKIYFHLLLLVLTTFLPITALAQILGELGKTHLITFDCVAKNDGQLAIRAIGNKKNGIVTFNNSGKLVTLEARSVQRATNNSRNLLGKLSKADPGAHYNTVLVKMSDKRRLREAANLASSFGLYEGNLLNDIQTVQDASEALETVLRNGRQQIANYKELVKQLKKCRGCASSPGSRVRAKKNGKKIKSCGCYTKTVSATLEFHYGNNPEAQNNCQAFGLAKWSAEETRNATEVEVFYSWTGSGAPLRSKTGTPPYDDTYPFYNQEITAGEGSHQLAITKGSASAGNPNTVVDCSNMSARQMELVTDPYVEAKICPLKRR